MKTKVAEDCKELLHTNGYRITERRVTLLTHLKETKKPVTVSELQEALGMDKVTLYRALEEFVHSKILTKVNLQGKASYYEFTHQDHHHHHLVCEKCGKIEDIKYCHEEHLQREVLKQSKTFSSITSHSLEFFGICKTCSR